MALFKQWLLFQKTQAQFLAPTWRLLKSLNSSLTRPNALASVGTAQIWYTYTPIHTHTHTNFCYPYLSALLKFILLNTTVCLSYQEVGFFREAITHVASSTL